MRSYSPSSSSRSARRWRRRRGSSRRGWVRVSCKRGAIVCKAYVTKRIKPMTVDGKPTHVIGVPLHWGFTGQTLKGYAANALTPSVGDANTQTPEFKAFLVNVEKIAAPSGVKDDHVQSAVAGLHPHLGHDPYAAVGSPARAGGRQAHRRHPLHRLQGVPGGLHGMERPARRGRPFRGHLRQSARSRSQHLDARCASPNGRTTRAISNG